MKWNELKPREKKIMALLAAAFVLGAYFNLIKKPLDKKIVYYKSQIKKSQAQLGDLKSKMPQDTEVAHKLKGLESERDALAEKIAVLEQKIPSRLTMTQMVGEFTRLAKDVKLEYVKQRIVKDQGYSRIILETKFFGSFANAVNYLAAVETISPFLKVEEMEILEPKSSKSSDMGGPSVRLVVSCLLSDSSAGADLKAADVQSVPMKRDLLVSSLRPATPMEESKFHLEGITYNPQNPTVIINGEVYKINSEINGYKIKKISMNSVVLTDGVQDHILSFKKPAELKA